MICPKCGENLPKNRVCNKCGTKISVKKIRKNNNDVFYIAQTHVNKKLYLVRVKKSIFLILGIILMTFILNNKQKEALIKSDTATTSQNNIAISVSKVTEVGSLLRIYLVIKNVSNASVFVSPGDFTLSIANGSVCNSLPELSFNSMKLQPKQQMSNFIEFSIRDSSGTGIQTLDYNGNEYTQELSVDIE
jgi:ribosomal protein L32